MYLLTTIRALRVSAARQRHERGDDERHVLTAAAMRSPMLALNTTYGTAWQRALQILQGRLPKFGVQLDF